MPVDLALLASTFVTVFLAELGDKTQLAIVTISGTSNRPGAVFAGSGWAVRLTAAAPVLPGNFGHSPAASASMLAGLTPSRSWYIQ
jgi:putative Ca2+/H+ antiporter (TMEM165/GDT1 family)